MTNIKWKMENGKWKMENESCLQLSLMLQRKLNQGVAAVQVQFGADAAAVVFDGAVMDTQFISDLFAGLIFGDQAQDGAFGRREVGQTRLGAVGAACGTFEEVSGNGRARVVLPSTDGSQAIDDVGGRAVFEDIAHDT